MRVQSNVCVTRHRFSSVRLIQACGLREAAGRAGAAEVFVVVVTLADDVGAFTLHSRLVGEIIEVHLSEGAEVEPVVGPSSRRPSGS